MKLKSFVAVTAVVTAGVALAKFESNTTLCQIQVSSPYTNTVVALPLVEVGGSADTINPADYVLTNGLVTGSYMYIKEGDTLKGWALTAQGWEPCAVAEARTNAVIHSVAAADNEAVARGNAVWLFRNGASLGEKPIYLWGQLSLNEATNTATGAYTMMGNASTNAVRLTALNWQVPPAVGDKVMFIDDSAYGVTNEFTCSSSANPPSWTFVTNSTRTVIIRGQEKQITTFFDVELAPNSVNDPTIDPGAGFYFYRKSTEGTAPKVVW